MSPVPFHVPEVHTLGELLPAFEYEQLIALGGSGTVYKARQPALDRDVAIKILPREFSDEPFFRNAFESEAKAMARLSHTNLIRVYDSGEIGGMLYMVMEYVPGKSLFNSAHGKAIDPKQAVRIALSACQGIAHAHANGIFHGDIRPANILLNTECEPKIGSFGFAKCIPAYMAPEIALSPEMAGAQSDVYAIGVVLRELLTGTPAGMYAEAGNEISDPRLAAICREATHEDPAARCQSAAALATQLENWLTTGSSRLITTQPPATRPLPKPALKRSAPITTPLRRPSQAWSLVKNCAVIAVLLCAIHMLFGAYQTKKETIARLQAVEDAKPRVVKIIRLEPKAKVPSQVSLVSTQRQLLAGNVE